MNIKKGNLENGLDSVAEYLGLNKDKAIFLHSTCFSPESEVGRRRVSRNNGRMLHAEVLAYTSNDATGSYSAITYTNQGLLEYLHEAEVLHEDKLLRVGNDNIFEYPYNSVSAMLKEEVRQDEALRKRLEGSTIVSSYLSEDDVETAKLLNGRVLMDPLKQIEFNSKYNLHRYSPKYNYRVPYAVYFNGINMFSEKFKEFIDMVKEHCSEKINMWVKLESQSSGKGNMYFEDIMNLNKNNIINQIKEISSSIHDDDYINNNIPLVMELDVESLKDEVEIQNIGVEAVIGDGGVTIVGSVRQKTEGGVYIGSIMDDDTYNYAGLAEDEAGNVFNYMYEEGYRGFVTIDVLLTKNSKTGEVKGYNIDPNARLSGGTMLLANIHRTQKKLGRRIFGFSYANSIKNSPNIIEKIREYAADYLYMGEKSGYKGIIPVILNDITPLPDGSIYLKTVVVDDSLENAVKEYEKFKERIIRDKYE